MDMTIEENDIKDLAPFDSIVGNASQTEGTEKRDRTE